MFADQPQTHTGQPLVPEVHDRIAAGRCCCLHTARNSIEIKDGSSVPKPGLQPICHDLEVASTACVTRLFNALPTNVQGAVEMRILRECSGVDGARGFLGMAAHDAPFPHIRKPITPDHLFYDFCQLTQIRSSS